MTNWNGDARLPKRRSARMQVEDAPAAADLLVADLGALPAMSKPSWSARSWRSSVRASVPVPATAQPLLCFPKGAGAILRLAGWAVTEVPLPSHRHRYATTEVGRTIKRIQRGRLERLLCNRLKFKQKILPRISPSIVSNDVEGRSHQFDESWFPEVSCDVRTDTRTLVALCKTGAGDADDRRREVGRCWLRRWG